MKWRTAEFLHTRLEIALDRLKDRADQLRVAEEDSRRLTVYEKAKAKR